MAESTSIPTENEIPAKEMVFKERPKNSKIIKVAIILMGIARATTVVKRWCVKR